MTYRTDCLGESNGNEIAIYIGVTVSGIDRSGARGPRATKVNIDVGRVQQSTPQPFKERSRNEWTSEGKREQLPPEPI